MVIRELFTNKASGDFSDGNNRYVIGTNNWDIYQQLVILWDIYRLYLVLPLP